MRVELATSRVALVAPSLQLKEQRAHVESSRVESSWRHLGAKVGVREAEPLARGPDGAWLGIDVSGVCEGRTIAWT